MRNVTAKLPKIKAGGRAENMKLLNSLHLS